MSLISILTMIYFLLGALVLIGGIYKQSQNIKDMRADNWLVAVMAGLFWLPIIIIMLGIVITKPLQLRYQRWRVRRDWLKMEAQEERDEILRAQADVEMAAYWKKKAISDEKKRQQDILAGIPA